MTGISISLICIVYGSIVALVSYFLCSRVTRWISSHPLKNESDALERLERSRLAGGTSAMVAILVAAAAVLLIALVTKDGAVFLSVLLGSMIGSALALQQLERH